MDNLLKGFLRSDHAGEVGAVYIYKGILKIAKDPELVNFSKRHLATEESHLQKIEGVLLKKDRSKLVWLWKVAGFLLGFLPTLFGPKIVFATIEAVEAFVEEHYEEQVPMQGPPATAFAGPPATTQVENDPMDDYNRQMEEYNRKMAEYEAWQRAQGSQVVADTTEHE